MAKIIRLNDNQIFMLQRVKKLRTVLGQLDYKFKDEQDHAMLDAVQEAKRPFASLLALQSNEVLNQLVEKVDKEVDSPLDGPAAD